MNPTTTMIQEKPTKIQQVCKTCGLDQDAFHAMFGPGPTGCEMHGSDICSSCGIDRNTLRAKLNSGNKEKSLDASLLAAACPECMKVLDLED